MDLTCAADFRRLPLGGGLPFLWGRAKAGVQEKRAALPRIRVNAAVASMRASSSDHFDHARQKYKATLPPAFCAAADGSSFAVRLLVGGLHFCYVQCIKAAFTPYHNALQTISNEVKAFGGSGNIHGCIVDIDFYNHIYLNLYDAKITPYFAWDTVQKVAFPNMRDLLENSPVPPQLPNGTPMLNRFISCCKPETLPILSRKKRMKAAKVPEIVLDTSMYEPNRAMRSIQYIFDQDVIRIWRDEILTMSPVQSIKALP